MYFFIFESIGTSELILVGIVALIFLGPRKLPELAKKAGKIMAEFRGTANEFKQTWEREVNFDEDAKSLSLSNIDDQIIPREGAPASPETTTVIPDAPAIRAADPDSFKHLIEPDAEAAAAEQPAVPEAADDKRNWL